jgi:hypothetical protein
MARSRSALELCLLPPVFLDYYLNDSRGDTMWVGFPTKRGKFPFVWERVQRVWLRILRAASKLIVLQFT